MLKKIQMTDWPDYELVHDYDKDKYGKVARPELTQRNLVWLAERLNEVIELLNNTRQGTIGGFCDAFADALRAKEE